MKAFLSNIKAWLAALWAKFSAPNFGSSVVGWASWVWDWAEWAIAALWTSSKALIKNPVAYPIVAVIAFLSLSLGWSMAIKHSLGPVCANAGQVAQLRQITKSQHALIVQLNDEVDGLKSASLPKLEPLPYMPAPVVAPTPHTTTPTHHRRYRVRTPKQTAWAPF